MSELPGYQYSIKRMMYALVWIGIGLMMWRATSPFNWEHFIDDDPDNIRPRILAAFYLVPLAGAIGSFQARQFQWALGAFLLWLLLCVAIIAIGMLRLI